MKKRIILSSRIQEEITGQGYTLSSFSRHSGINRGVLSATLNGNPPKSMSINQLDQMSQALGRPAGWLYERYIEQCFDDMGKANWRRVRPLLLRCMQLKRHKLVHLILYQLMEDPAQLGHVFELAEEWTTADQSGDAIVFYKCVIEHERNYQSERLAISHYRIFKFTISTDTEQNYKAALQFQPFCERLPDHLQLDGLLKLSNIFYTVEEWELLSEYADKLQALAQRLYDQFDGVMTPPPERPLVVYYGQGYLLKEAYYEQTGQYELALQYCSKYSDLSWFKGLDAQGREEVEIFRICSIANNYGLKLYLGNFGILLDYVKFLEQHPAEILPGILNVIKAANIHNINIDDFLDKFQIHIKENLYLDIRQKRYVTDNQYVNLCYQLAIYKTKTQKNLLEVKEALSRLESALKKYNMTKTMDYSVLLNDIIRSMQ